MFRVRVNSALPTYFFGVCVWSQKLRKLVLVLLSTRNRHYFQISIMIMQFHLPF